MLLVRRWKIYLPLTLAAGFASSWLGFRSENALIQRGGEPALPLRTTIKRIFVKPTDAVARLDQIRSRSRGGELNSRDQAECWKIIRGLDAFQLQTYLDELPADDENIIRINNTLTAMLFSRWAQIDPLAAGEGALKRTSRQQMITGFRAVMAAWIPRDPEAAMKWAAVERPDIKFNGALKLFAGRMAGEFYVREDPDTALSRAADNPTALATVRTALARKGGGSEEDRQRYFKMAVTPQGGLAEGVGFKNGVAELASAWARSDPAGALASTESYGMAKGLYGEFRAGVIGTVAYSDPVRMLDWLQQPGVQVDETLKNRSYQVYLYQHPEQAADWAVKNDRLDLTASAVKQGAEQLLIQQAQGITTPERTTAVAVQFQTWQQHQPDQAAQWLSQQTAELREQLTAPAHATKH